MEEKEFIAQSDSIDIADPRNLNFSDYEKELDENAAGTISKWDKDTKIWDQGDKPRCTRYASTLLVNGYGVNEYKQNGMIFSQIDPATMYNGGTKNILDRAIELKKAGLISGYTQIPRTAELHEQIRQVDKALENGLYIQTGSDNGRWGIYKAPYVYVKRTDGKKVGHARDIVDKVTIDGKKYYVCPNSFSERFGDKGYFYLPEEQLNLTFTKYVYLPAEHKEVFAKFRNRMRAIDVAKTMKKMYADGYTNGNATVIKKIVQKDFNFTDADL